MVRVSPQQNSFNGGEWSPHLWSRDDVDSYPNSCRQVDNFELLVQGAAVFRSGFRYIRRDPETAQVGVNSRLIRFEFSTEQAYAIEFTDEKIRFYRNKGVLVETAKTITGITQANPAVVTSTAHGFNNGDEVFISGVEGMTQVNNRFFKVANVAANTFELVGLDSTAYDSYVSGGDAARIYELASPYKASEVFEIDFTQSADILFLVHPDYAPRQLIRNSDTDWSFEVFELKNGAWKDLNTTDTELNPTATTGSVTITATSTVGINGGDGFQSTDVGRLIRLRHSGNWGYVKITSVSSTTEVVADVKEDLGGSTATKDWQLGAFSDTDGYPSVVVFYQDRLTFMEAPGEPQGVFMSKRSDYNNFAPSAKNGEIFPDNAITLFLDSNTVNKAFWSLPIGRSLVIGTANSEWTLGANTSGEALTAVTAVAQEGTTFGSARVKAIKVNNTALFVGATEKSIGKVSYSFENDGYDADDMNLFSNHILRGGVRQLAYAREPDNRLYAVGVDGNLYTMAYKPDQNVNGWARIKTNGSVKSCAVIPSENGENNDLYIVVERKINGETYKFIEVQDDQFDINDSIEDAHFLDSAAKYDGRSRPDADLTLSDTTGSVTITASSAIDAAVNDQIRFKNIYAEITAVTSSTVVEADILSDYEFPTIIKSSDWELLKNRGDIGGLWHLEGQTVSILTNGATHPDRVITDGKVTLDDDYHVIHVGLGYEGRIVSRMFNDGSQTGAAQGKIKRINRVVLHLFNTLGGWVGITDYLMKDKNDTVEMQFRRTDDRMDETTGLKSGFFRESLGGGYAREGSIVIEQRQPLPMTINAILPDQTTYDGQ